MKKMRPFLATIACTMALFSCNNDPKPPAAVTPPPAEKKPVTVPRFAADSALSFIGKQVAFGPRVPGTDAHKKCRQWLVEKFRSYGATVTEQEFKAKMYTGKDFVAANIIASFNPQATHRVILAAHWDSRHIADQDSKDKDKPILGADDGGSGVGILVEVARQLKEHPTDLGVDLILFDAEDLGKNDVQTMDDAKTWCLGSQYWSSHPHQAGYRARFGILLDMVGANGARFTRDQVSMQYASEYVNKVWKMASEMGYGNYFVPDQTGEITDDHVFVNMVAGIPMLDIINRPAEGGFVSHWHTHRDNMQAIDRETIRCVGQLMLSVLYHEAQDQL